MIKKPNLYYNCGCHIIDSKYSIHARNEFHNFHGHIRGICHSYNWSLQSLAESDTISWWI